MLKLVSFEPWIVLLPIFHWDWEKNVFLDRPLRVHGPTSSKGCNFFSSERNWLKICRKNVGGMNIHSWNFQLDRFTRKKVMVNVSDLALGDLGSPSSKGCNFFSSERNWLKICEKLAGCMRNNSWNFQLDISNRKKVMSKWSVLDHFFVV